MYFTVQWVVKISPEFIKVMLGYYFKAAVDKKKKKKNCLFKIIFLFSEYIFRKYYLFLFMQHLNRETLIWVGVPQH